MLPNKNHSINDRIAPYWQAALELHEQGFLPAAVSKGAVHLPLIDEGSLEALERFINATEPINPYQGWAAAAVIDAVAQRQIEAPMLQARSAWLLARAANGWARPDLAAEAIGLAVPIFERLGETAWLAACAWQQNALPWTRPNFRQAVVDLEGAYRHLQESALEHLVPGCLLSLAFARLLLGEFGQALACIAESEGIFDAGGDTLNQARCWLRRSSVLRRQGYFNRSLENLIQAQKAFSRLSAAVDLARVDYQLGYIDLFNRNDYTAAEANFQKARDTFSHCQMPLWAALCDHGLGQVYLEGGRLSDAGRCLEQARTVLAEFDIIGALGDALFDSAKYARLVGDHAASVDHLHEAKKRYELVNAPLMVALAAMHLGSTYQEWGFHQRALHFLEQAQQKLIEMNHSSRLAECRMRLARVWLELNRPEEANRCLEKALLYYERQRRPAYLATVYCRRAEAGMLSGETERSVRYLEQALKLANQYDLGPQIAIAQRLLGECLCLSQQVESGLEMLRQAETSFSKMGLVFDQAGCLAALGDGLMRVNKVDAAQSAWRDALALNQEVVPAVVWLARSGLARIAESEVVNREALEQYRQAMKALNRQRRDFWQPDLAGTFLKEAAKLVDDAVSLAVKIGADEDALQFAEAGKAQSVIRRLFQQPIYNLRESPPAELKTAAGEIQTLQERIQTRYKWGRLRQEAEVEALIARLTRKVNAYRAARSHWERQHLQEINVLARNELEISRFCQTAGERLEGLWVALSYYLTPEHLIIVALIDGVCQSWKRPITSRTWYAMDSCTRASPSRPNPAARELQTLGEWLIPEEVAARVTPETFLLIAPHRMLHQLPWAALSIGENQKPLVMSCIPVVVPSLSCLSLLWERPAANPPPVEGLLVGASQFPGRSKRPLPEVENELTWLGQLIGERGRMLVGEEASWNRLNSIAGKAGLAHFSFCHVAGHGFFDSLSGRLSGISFYDRDVWLDELWDCAPWPPLVTMAACNSSQSLVYEGDEHMGLTTTLLAAGANTVVGSVWPVRDEDAANLFAAFYRYLLTANRPAKALALAQREAVREGLMVADWGSFICVGQP